MLKAWIAAFRFKTLPLALGAILIGSKLPTMAFSFKIFGFAALTAILLQVLSNLANDYGDYIKGTDKHRKDRQLAGGNISVGAMKAAIVVFSVLALASGLYLLYTAFGTDYKKALPFLGIGILSIIAAIAYTVGKRAYGYYGLGDLFVFIFFGLVGVVGCAYLYDQIIDPNRFLPAIAYGALAVGVLNVNNIRDMEKDTLNNKITLASKMGHEGAINFQVLLLALATITLGAHHLVTSYFSLAPVLVVVLGFNHIGALRKADSADAFNKQLRNLSLGALGVAVLFIFQLFL